MESGGLVETSDSVKRREGEGGSRKAIGSAQGGRLEREGQQKTRASPRILREVGGGEEEMAVGFAKGRQLGFGGESREK